MNSQTLGDRIKNGWSLEKALTQPVRRVRQDLA